MKKLILFLLIFCLSFILFSCKDLFSSDDPKNDPNVIAGDPNVDQGIVGYKTSAGSVKVGSNYYDIKSSFEVIKNDNGVATIKVVADLTKVPALAAWNNFIPASMKDATGKINTEIKLKMTTEGLQDYFNKDTKPHTIVKYDCNVGDQYKLSKSDGKTITRTVVSKSTTDDFPYGFMYIKTIAVEQDSRISGIKKFVFRANHKFGLVFLQLVAEDNTDASAYF